MRDETLFNILRLIQMPISPYLHLYISHYAKPYRPYIFMTKLLTFHPSFTYFSWKKYYQRISVFLNISNILGWDTCITSNSAKIIVYVFYFLFCWSLLSEKDPINLMLFARVFLLAYFAAACTFIELLYLLDFYCLSKPCTTWWIP